MSKSTRKSPWFGGQVLCVPVDNPIEDLLPSVRIGDDLLQLLRDPFGSSKYFRPPGALVVSLGLHLVNLILLFEVCLV